MPREFETNNEITVHATPEQVWDAIARGPGVDAWFMGRTEIEPGKSVRTEFPGGFTMESTVTDWDPPHRLAYRAEPSENGEFHAFEYLVQGREDSTTVVRVVHSGALANWDDEYDAIREGDAIYAGKLAAYLDHFAGATGPSVLVQREQTGDRATVMARLFDQLGLPATVGTGDRVRVEPDALEPIEGVVDLRADHALGLRTDDGILRFFHAMGTLVVEEHRYGGPAPRDWQGWLDRVSA